MVIDLRDEGLNDGLRHDVDPRRASERSPMDAQPTGGWYKDAIIYEIHVRTFFDGNGDGIGDFKGLLEKLDYLQALGVTALWLLPFYPSPLKDDGYDISDYRQIHPSYGTLRDFRTFLREAHRRGLRVITELVLAHTSEEHPWFQRARRSRPGSTQRDFYVWSDTPDKFSQARIIFTDSETSNWSYDQVAKAYFWHRFYSQQPSLNYDNPTVRQAMFDVVDFWLSMGVDGLRLDAVPYLYAREGTSCENLPETFAFLRDLRAHVDARFDDRMILAEANQWPEDAIRYMGEGDMCHMAFHFPLMPRMFMAARQEDRFPIVDILTETPTAPPECQWGLFLRNHDELTLEMVTDEERDYMYRVYAQDPQARVNVGIRRRLAPLLGNDRSLIEMMNGLLFSMPGTPVVYYGDEIGMGDNIYLGDRDAVRTPMQWDSDRNAGFSRANPQRLYLPTIIDPEYHYQAVNVAAQQQNPNSLLWWMRRLISLRQRYHAFGRGTLEILRPENRKIFSFVRSFNGQTILCIFNLSRYVQCAELDLSQYAGAVPVELFGNQDFPSIGELPYFITLGPHGFYWFLLEADDAPSEVTREKFEVTGEWDELLSGPARSRFENYLASYLPARRWFAQKARTITSVSIIDHVAVYAPGATALPRRGASPVAVLVIVNVELDHGSAERYALPLTYLEGEAATHFTKWHAEGVVAELRSADRDGVLIDATYSPAYVRAMADLVARRRTASGPHGRLVGVPTTSLREFDDCLKENCPVTTLSTEQSNSSALLGESAIVKFFRRFEEGINPEVEIGRFLDERTRFTHSPRVGGSIEYHRSGTDAAPATVAVIDEYIAHEEDGWRYVVDSLTHDLEEAVAHADDPELEVQVPPHVFAVDVEEPPSAQPLVGGHLEWATLLGQRTAELHLELASHDDDPAFAPEVLTALDRQAMFHGARSLTRQVFHEVRSLDLTSPHVAQVLSREDEILSRLRRLTEREIDAGKIRCHGDFHLGQVLWTGKDFVIIDFEGEPYRSLSRRRLKRPAFVDVAGMVRSLHYASRAGSVRLSRNLGITLHEEDEGRLESWLTYWHRWVSGAFIDSYLKTARGASFLPSDRADLAALLDFFLLEKAVYELSYEANARPTWVDIPARGLLDILDGTP